MKAKKPLEPRDFPMEHDRRKITTSNGEKIAEADSDPMAERSVIA